MKRLTQSASLVAALLIAGLALALLAALLHQAPLHAAPLPHPAAADPQLTALTVSSTLPCSDTHPAAPFSRTVYFDNQIPGWLTLTFAVSGTPPLTLTAAPAFGHAPTLVSTGTLVVVSYTVATSATSQPSVVYTLTGAASPLGVTVALTYTRDVTAPLAPALAAPLSGTWNTTCTVPLDWQEAIDRESGVAAYSLTLDGGLYFTTATALRSDCLDDDIYTWTVRAVDALGHVSAAAAPWTFLVDTTAPTVTVDTASQAISQPAGSAFQLLGRVADAAPGQLAALTVTVGTAHYTTATISGTAWLLDWPVPAANGLPYTVTAIARDAAGHLSAPAGPLTLTVDNILYTDFVYLPLVIRNNPPAWQTSSGLSGVTVYDVAVCPGNSDLQYAGTASGVYRSVDGGATWQHWALNQRATPLAVNPQNCGRVFAATWGSGVYQVTGQNTYVPFNNGLDDLYLYGLAISANGQTLYAGTDGTGVYRTATSGANWSAANSGIWDLRIRSLRIVDGIIYAGSRRCIFYSSLDGGNSWNTLTVIPGGPNAPCNDAQVWSVAPADDALYAGLGQNEGLYRSTGLNWVHEPSIASTVYWVEPAPDPSQVYVSTFGQGAYRCDIDGCAQLVTTGLGTSLLRGLAVAALDGDDWLLAASDAGVWRLLLVP